MSKPVAMITGASRGIGKAIALHLAKRGYDLIITCRRSINELELVAEQVRNLDARCLEVPLDASDFEACKDFFTYILPKNYRHVDLLVNNAGVAYLGLLTDMSHKEWQQVIATNLDSLFNTCKFTVPMMVSQKSGNIINISSIWGNDGASCEVAYSASKGGVNSFTKALAKELAPSGIRVNAIACGAIDTEMNQWMTEEDRQSLTDEIGLGRLGKPEEIAKLVTFIASPEASYLTGQIITADGGM